MKTSIHNNRFFTHNLFQEKRVIFQIAANFLAFKGAPELDLNESQLKALLQETHAEATADLSKAKENIDNRYGDLIDKATNPKYHNLTGLIDLHTAISQRPNVKMPVGLQDIMPKKNENGLSLYQERSLYPNEVKILKEGYLSIMKDIAGFHSKDHQAYVNEYKTNEKSTRLIKADHEGKKHVSDSKTDSIESQANLLAAEHAITQINESIASVPTSDAIPTDSISEPLGGGPIGQPESPAVPSMSTPPTNNSQGVDYYNSSSKSIEQAPQTSIERTDIMANTVADLVKDLDFSSLENIKKALDANDSVVTDFVEGESFVYKILDFQTGEIHTYKFEKKKTAGGKPVSYTFIKNES